ncbi:hypothetical protein A8926_7231 [Saccharopolyspora spinosa]|uniref:Uncharacterized protein n=1 Tax=Saccharopolyspora spinosa TaxID=60894 RepID=A0A2N3Y873_SACSN|nr:hypothetical protein A8926_7231 [Saccharopolyspora spinosa]
MAGTARAAAETPPRWLVFFGEYQVSASNFEAQGGLIRSTTVFSAVYDDLSPARFVWIGLAVKMRPFDTSHLGRIFCLARQIPSEWGE